MKCLAPIAILILINIAFVEGQESSSCREWSPICGSDGVTYDNGCVAEAALLGIPPELVGSDWELPEVRNKTSICSTFSAFEGYFQDFISCHEVCPCGQEEKDNKSCHSSQCEEKLGALKRKAEPGDKVTTPSSVSGPEDKNCIEWSRGGETCTCWEVIINGRRNGIECI